MIMEGESRERVAEKEENLGEKLRRGLLVGKREGPCTPVVSSWRLFPTGLHNHTNIKDDPSFSFAINTSTRAISVSARKLAAALWEHHYYISPPKMHRPNHTSGVTSSGPHPRLRCLRHHYLHKDKPLDLSNLQAHNCPSSPDLPESASSLRRHVATSLMQHHQSIERNNHAPQPVSPASYGSSMEVTPYDPAVTPTSSVEFKGRIGQSHYGLKTSAELLKVLNRIWSLEEQYASNMLLIKALKTELEHARLKIKELLRERKADRHEIDDIVQQISEGNLVRKSEEQELIHAAVKSAKDELEGEKKLRKRSESLHRKLAREISEVKSNLSTALKDLESERKSRKLLEDLCDEFARGIKDYEQEVHALKHKTDKDCIRRDDHDRLILHISESWLDERMQMQIVEEQSGFSGKDTIVDKLQLEIETFLRANHFNTSKKAENLLARERGNSMESVPLNEAVSAPQDVGHEDSLDNSSDCIEIHKPSNTMFNSNDIENVDGHFDKTTKSNDAMKKKPESSARIMGRSPSSLQVKFEQKMASAISSNENKKSQLVNIEQGQVEVVKPSEVNISQKSEHCEVTKDGNYEKRKKHDEISNYTIDNLIRSQHFLSDSGSMNLDNSKNEASCSSLGWRNQTSTVRQWMAKHTSSDLDLPESSLRLPARENTLKAKLLEARSKGQWSRKKASRGSS